MDVFRGAKLVPSPGSGTAIALGNFDGFHLGHRALIGRLLQEARTGGNWLPVLYTFNPHPAEVLRPDSAPNPLFSREEMIEQAASLGVPVAVVEPFTEQFAAIRAEDFVREYLVGALLVRRLVVGEDFRFGYQRLGTVETLRQLGLKHDFSVVALARVAYAGEPVSSSRIRRALSAGEIELVSALLGRRYSVRGRVMVGAGRGRKLGIPTANVPADSGLALRRGVYVTLARTGGRAFPAITNLGIAPTFHEPGSRVWFETHLLDQNIELVGAEMEIEFVSYLREERRFSGREELVEQIRQDIALARKWWQLKS